MFTVTASCLKPLLAPPRNAKPKLDLMDLPAYARNDLGVHGVNLTTDLLAGMTREKIEQLRDRGDKARCACLMLIEHDPQKLGDASEAVGLGAVERLRRVLRAANVLGCNACAVQIGSSNDDASFQRAVERLKASIHGLEKLDVNVLILPAPGLCGTPERITELLKKVGGFRMGTFPDFQTAAGTADAIAYLKRLAPYAPVVNCSTVDFVADTTATPGPEDDEPTMKHASYDLRAMLDAITSVGFQGTLALDYRGKGDPGVGVVRSRLAFERVMSQEQDELEGLIDELEEEDEPENDDPA
jgi:sugar phosphate isomerase/epimerase